MMDDRVLNRVEAVSAALVAGSADTDERMTQHYIGRLLTGALTER